MTMVPVLDIDPSRGKAAIYTVDSAAPTDEAPLLNPRAYLSRVKYHSDFIYPKVVMDVTVSVTLAAVADNASRYQTYNLFPHGLAGIPFCLGLFEVPNVGWCPLQAGTPTWGQNAFTGAYTSSTGTAQLISLGANSAQIILNEAANASWSANNSGVIPAKTFNVRVLVTDILL